MTYRTSILTIFWYEASDDCLKFLGKPVSVLTETFPFLIQVAEEEVQAAVKIQAFLRGYSTRKSFRDNLRNSRDAPADGGLHTGLGDVVQANRLTESKEAVAETDEAGESKAAVAETNEAGESKEAAEDVDEAGVSKGAGESHDAFGQVLPPLPLPLPLPTAVNELRDPSGTRPSYMDLGSDDDIDAFLVRRAAKAMVSTSHLMSERFHHPGAIPDPCGRLLPPRI